jgi:hypothetical protein
MNKQPWRKKLGELERLLKETGKQLDDKIAEARALKLAIEAEHKDAPDHGSRRTIERMVADAERAASATAYAAQRIERTLTFKSERQQVEAALEEAQRVCRADYYNDVRDVAEEFCKMWRGGEFDDNDSAMTWLHETIDGHGRVIYTAQAMDCLRYSGNDGAFIDSFGTDGLVKDGCINWSAMAYAAFEADILERINAEDDVDTSEDPPGKLGAAAEEG